MIVLMTSTVYPTNRPYENVVQNHMELKLHYMLEPGLPFHQKKSSENKLKGSEEKNILM